MRAGSITIHARLSLRHHHFFPQHCLYFLPDLQGHGSFRPTAPGASGAVAACGGRSSEVPDAATAEAVRAVPVPARSAMAMSRSCDCVGTTAPSAAAAGSAAGAFGAATAWSNEAVVATAGGVGGRITCGDSFPLNTRSVTRSRTVESISPKRREDSFLNSILGSFWLNDRNEIESRI